MEAEQILNRALILLEFDKLAEAEAALHKAVEQAEQQQDELVLISAMCCLGDFLYSEGRDHEARNWLKKALALRNEENQDELKDEFAMAEEFLYEMGELPIN